MTTFPTQADAPTMSVHESSCWRVLLELGARPIEMGGLPGLDLRPIRATSVRKTSQLVTAVRGVANGRNDANHWHVDRAGRPVFLATKDATTAKRIKDELQRVQRLKR